MNEVIICENPFRSETWKFYETDNVSDLLVDHFHGKWPRGAKIYHQQVAETCEVTPHDEASIFRLQGLSGKFYVLVFPEWAIVIPIIISIAVQAVVYAIGLLFRPSNNTKNQQQTSPNNQLTNRQNVERPNQRIEDIYGEVWSTPTLIQQPYRIFQGNKEVEYAYMCIGRGEYDISKVRDDLTEFDDIDGASAEFYSPFTSPNSGDDPFLRIGNPIHETIKTVKRYESANGQVLRAPNANKFKADKNISFVSADSIVTSANIDFTDYFAVGSVSSPTHITISNSLAKDPAGVHSSVSLDGTYEISDVIGNEIVLTNPALVNSNWSALASFSGGASTYGSPTLTSSDDKWIGPFTIIDPDVSEIWCNFVCPNGLFELDKNANQHPMDSEVEIGIQAIDASGNPTGSEVFYYGTIIGSSEVRTLRGITVKCPLPLAGPCVVRARRFSSTDLRDNWNVVDQTVWKDLYSVSPVTETDFGNVTTVQVVTWPTQDALAIKTRKFNCLIGRRIGYYIPRYYTEGPHSAAGYIARGCRVPSLSEVIWVKSSGSGLATLGVWTDSDAYSEINLTGITVGVTVSALNNAFLLSDGTYIYAVETSNYDTAKWYKFPIAGGSPVASLGGVGPLSTPFNNTRSALLATLAGTQYVLHGRDTYIQRINTSTFALDSDITGVNGNSLMQQDSSGNIWLVKDSTHLTKIDGTTLAITHIAVSGASFASVYGFKYVAADDSLIIATASNLYKYDIGTNAILATVAGTYAGLSNVGSDGNICATLFNYAIGVANHPIQYIMKFDTSTLAQVGSTYDMSNYSFYSGGYDNTYSSTNFLYYESTNNVLIQDNFESQVVRRHLTLAPSYHPEILAASKNAADILVAMALDPYIGNRTEDEIDFETIYDSIGPGGANEVYFGTPLCSEFCYTFDDSKVSFEEMATDVANAAFSTAYRRGNILSVFFEKQTDNSVMLFNHRNKLPHTEVRTVRFGLPNDFDGVDIDYIDPKKPNQPDIDATNTFHFPEDLSAKAPKKMTLVGVRNNVQAKILGWRLFNKLRYQNIAADFSCTQEAATCVRNERVLVADNTRADTQDGDVLDQVALELELSEPITFVVGRTYTIFLQHYDKTVEAIGITAGSASNKVVLDTTPALPIVIDKAKYVRTLYQIVDDSPTRSNAFLLSELTPQQGMVFDVKAINYDDRYYEHDTDFINAIVTEYPGGGGFNAGYSAQARSDVFVDGRCMPWDKTDNPSYDYGKDDGRPPVVVELQVSAGATVNISADAPGSPVSVWFATFETNTVRCSDSRDPVDASGTSTTTGYTSPITGTTLGSSGTHFPTNFMPGSVLALGGLCGAFAHISGGVYVVDQVLDIGFGGNFTVPSGATHLLLGINDDHFSDNQGGFQVHVTQLGATGSTPTEDNTTDPGDNQDYYIITVDGN